MLRTLIPLNSEASGYHRNIRVSKMHVSGVTLFINSHQLYSAPDVCYRFIEGV